MPRPLRRDAIEERISGRLYKVRARLHSDKTHIQGRVNNYEYNNELVERLQEIITAINKYNRFLKTIRSK